MNAYAARLNRLEFVITYACTGRCIHCSEGSHEGCTEHIEPCVAAKAVQDLASAYALDSVMTFGGEALLYPDAVCAVHAAARDAGVPKRQLITNGYFSKDPAAIHQTAQKLADSGVNHVLLSADAFHQQTIPLSPVLRFAKELSALGVPLRVHPAWLVSPEDPNPYNLRTRELLAAFDEAGIPRSDGNVIFPAGSALVYLSEYFASGPLPQNPYEEDPFDLRAVSVSPDGSLLGGNLYEENILSILERYTPGK